MRLYLGSYVTDAIIMAAIDAVWLTLMAGPLYRAQLGPLLMPGFSAPPAILFYLIYVVGLVALVVLPSVGAGDLTAIAVSTGWGAAAARGALFGLCAYATYDLTNQATLNGWSTLVTIADLAWGTILTAITGAATTAIAQAFLVK